MVRLLHDMAEWPIWARLYVPIDWYEGIRTCPICVRVLLLTRRLTSGTHAYSCPSLLSDHRFFSGEWFLHVVSLWPDGKTDSLSIAPATHLLPQIFTRHSTKTKTKTLAAMPSANLITLLCMSFLATSSVAHMHPPPPPPGHIPIPFGTHISGGPPHFPTGVFPTGLFPTGVFPTGAFPTASNPHGHPHIPLPTVDHTSEGPEHEKRYEGPRHQPRPVAWQHYKPNNAEKPPAWDGPHPPPPFATIGPRPAGTQGFPTAGPTAGRPSARPTGF
jgi:hypothetical protein